MLVSLVSIVFVSYEVLRIVSSCRKPLQQRIMISEGCRAVFCGASWIAWQDLGEGNIL